MNDSTVLPPGSPQESDPNKDRAEAIRKLAIDRSNQDASQSNEHLRATAQATILINGGAATAVLAFVSASIAKDKIDLQLIAIAGQAIRCYAIGVAFSPLVIWAMNVALKHWNQSWQQVVHDPGSDASGKAEHLRAYPYYIAANLFLGGAIASFIVGSLILANGFINMPFNTSAALPSPAAIGVPVTGPSTLNQPSETTLPAPKPQ